MAPIEPPTLHLTSCCPARCLVSWATQPETLLGLDTGSRQCWDESWLWCRAGGPASSTCPAVPSQTWQLHPQHPAPRRGQGELGREHLHRTGRELALGEKKQGRKWGWKKKSDRERGKWSSGGDGDTEK